MLNLEDVLNEKSLCYLKVPLPCVGYKPKIKYLMEYITSTAFHLQKQWKLSDSERNSQMT